MIKTFINRLKNRTNPEVLNLENQILTKLKEIKTKQKQLDNLPPWKPILSIEGSKHLKGRGSNEIDPHFQQRESFKSQISNLTREEKLLLNKLETIHPFLGDLKKHLTDQDNTIKNLTQKIEEGQDLAIKEYQNQFQVLQRNYESTSRKLDRVRNLVMDNSLESLKRAVRRGEI